MLNRPYQTLSGRVSDSDLHKGAIAFLLGDKSIDMDVPGSTRSPFSDGDEVDVVVRPGVIFKSALTAYAFRIVPNGEAHAAGRWREMIFFILGIFGFLAIALIAFLDRKWPSDWKLWVSSAVALVYGWYRLRQIGVAKRLLESTPNTSLERTRDR